MSFYFLGLDVLINSAGILTPGSTESLALDDFDHCWNINTRAAFVLTQAALPHLLQSKGNIVHVSSVIYRHTCMVLARESNFTLGDRPASVPRCGGLQHE